ncbi:MAG TPA: hypothetical protein VGN53_10975 [Klebsiella sp.]|jgi:hypothetical protein
MKNNKWFVHLHKASIPEHKFRPVKWLAFIAFLLLLAQLAVEFLLSE